MQDSKKCTSIVYESGVIELVYELERNGSSTWIGCNEILCP